MLFVSNVQMPAGESQQLDVTRGTRSSQLRQMPRRPAAGSGTSAARVAATVAAAAADGTEDFLDKTSHRFKRRGLKESSRLAAMRQENRDRTLSQIDEVLHGLYDNAATWSEAQHKRHVVHKSEREIMNEMRTFAKPYAGVKGLIDMVDQVVEEFNS